MEHTNIQPATENSLALWPQVQARLKTAQGPEVFDAFFARLQFEGLAEGVLTLSTATDHQRWWIEKNYIEQVARASRAQWPWVKRVRIRKRKLGAPHAMQTSEISVHSNVHSGKTEAPRAHQAPAGLKRNTPARQKAVRRAEKPSLKLIADTVCTYYDVDPEVVFAGRRSKENDLARNVFCYFAERLSGRDRKVIADYIGHKSRAGIANTLGRVEDKLAENRKFAKEIQTLRDTICRATAAH